MAKNDLLKKYSDQHTNDFGNFAPKNNGASSSAGDGAKSGASNGASAGQSKANEAAQAVANQGKSVNASLSAAKKLSESAPVQGAKNTMMADLKASVTGEDPEQLEAEERQRSQDPMVSIGKSAAKKSMKKGMSAFNGQLSTAGLFGKAKNALGSLVHGAKVLGSKLFGGMNGIFGGLTVGISKAGAAVGAFFHTSATIGTVVVVSGSVAAASIPIIGGTGYFVNQLTQRTDGCIPNEYEEKLNDDQSIEAQGREVAEIARNWCTPSGANHYVWGGWSIGPKDDYDPNNANSGGADCGHFCQLCFWKAGSTVLTPDHPYGTCDTIRDVGGGKYVVKTGHITEADCKPGDILNNNHHAWIYIGNGEIAEASCARIGLRVAPWRGDANCVTRPYESKNGKTDESGGGGQAKADAELKKNMDLCGETGKKIWTKYHIWPSVLIAQAMCETRVGTDGSFCAKRLNWFCIKAYDSNPGAASDFPSAEVGIEAAAKNYWGGASSEYYNVITSTSPQEQMKHICKSGWASSHYDDAAGATGGNLKKVWDTYNLSQYDEGIVDFTPDMSAYGGSTDADSIIDAGGADENKDIAEKTADDGCGDEMEGKDNAEATAFHGQGIVHKNGWTFLDFDMNAVFQLGHQKTGTGDCYIYAIGYADLVMRGKWKFNGAATPYAMEKTYGDPSSHYGMPGKIGGKEDLPSSESAAMEKIKKSIMEDNKPVTVCTTAWGGHHFMTVVGWKDSAGTNPKWEDLVVIDSAPPTGLSGNDYYENTQFHIMKANFNGHYLGSGAGGATYDGWTK